MRQFQLLLFIFLLSLSSSAFALRCDGQLVSEGDRKFVVVAKCGEPILIEKWVEETVFFTIATEKPVENIDIVREGTISNVTTSFVEEWTYNFGSNRFIYFLRFINGKLRKIETGPKGFDGEILSGNTRTRCGQLVEPGDRKIEVIMKCGDPTAIEYLQEARASAIFIDERLRKKSRDPAGRKDDKDRSLIKVKNFEETKSQINVEEWTYNFGPTQFFYFVRFENSRVVKVEQGGYGY